MTEQSNCLLSRCRLFSKSAGFVAGLVGSLVLVGWLFDCAVLKSVFPSMVPMNPATAVNFILAGLALWLLHSADRHSRARRIGCWMGLLVATMGLIKLGDHFNLFAIRIDQVLFAVKSGNNLMSPNTALAFVFVGFALGGLDVETRRGNCPAEGFALFTAFLALLALLGYVHGVQSLSAFGTFFPMALPTAATFLFISLGILGARPDRGLMRTFTGADAGGMVVRRLLPATIAIICLVNWLQLEGARHELYTNEFGDALKSAVNVALFSLLIWWNAKVLQRVDAERRLAEEKLRRSEESLGVTLYSIGDAVLATDIRGCITRMNPVAEKLTGWAQAEAVGRPIADVFCIINEETCQPAVIPVEKVLASGDVHGLANHTILIARDGVRYPIADSAAPIHDQEGKILGVVLVFRDVTEEKNAEKVQKRLAAIVESSDDAIISKSLDGVITSWNPGAERLFGYSAAEIIGAPMTRLIPPDRLDEEPLILTRMQGGERMEHFESRRVKKNGEVVDVSITLSPIKNAAGNIAGISKIVRDITAHKQAEEELRKFNERLEELVATRTTEIRQALLTLDATEDGALIFDPETLLHAYVNKGAVQQLGYTREELLRMTPVQCTPDFTEARYREMLAPMLRGEIPAHRFTALHRHKDGHDIPVEINLQYIAPVGERPRFIAIARDITERKRTEQQIHRSQRLESIGTLAAGVAHDLNNAIAPIMMGVEIIKERYPEESQIVELFESSAKHAADMVRQLVSFAKGAEGERIALSPGHLVNEMEKIMANSFPKDIQLSARSDPKLPKVLGDATQLHQVLLNLCVNARDAMPHGGTLTVEAKSRDVDLAYARSVPSAKPGRYVALSVRDTGTGIPSEIIDRVFDPFFTTKGPEKGSGLGLSTVLGIVKGHGGFLQVYSQPGQGSTFTVYLPADTSGNDTEHLSKMATKFRGQGETILFVDDEPRLRDAARLVLRRLNFKPLTATDGADALILAAQHRTELSAIITDLHMPHMDGPQFVHALRQMLPDIPVAVASGRMEDEVATGLKNLGVTERLEKPFTETQLAMTLKNLLTPK